MNNDLHSPNRTENNVKAAESVGGLSYLRNHDKSCCLWCCHCGHWSDYILTSSTLAFLFALGESDYFDRSSAFQE
jgi:hypothetical protein